MEEVQAAWGSFSPQNLGVRWNPPTPHWNDFLFLTSDIKIIRTKWLSAVRQEPPSYQRRTTRWSQTDFFFFFIKGQYQPKASAWRYCKPSSPSQKRLAAGRQSWCQRLSSSVVLLGQRFLFDSGSSRVKTWLTTLRLASLFKLEPRKPQGLNFCHCNSALLWGTLSLSHTQPLQIQCVFLGGTKTHAVLPQCTWQEVAVPCVWEHACVCAVKLSLGSLPAVLHLFSRVELRTESNSCLSVHSFDACRAAAVKGFAPHH